MPATASARMTRPAHTRTCVFLLCQAGAGTVSSLKEAERTPEFAEYRAANADGARICLDVQAKLDDLAANGEAFADTPWIPDELSLAVGAALGCGELETG